MYSVVTHLILGFGQIYPCYFEFDEDCSFTMNDKLSGF